MNSQVRPSLLTAGLLSVVVLGTPSVRSEAPTAVNAETQEEIILQILELRQQIDDLLRALPPEVRQEVERRWQQRESVPTVDPPVVAPTTTEPVAETEAEVQLSTESAPGTPPLAPTPVEPIATAEATLPPCGGFQLLDTNGDKLVSGADRQWRFFRLWFDDGDGIVAETELESLFELGVRLIDIDLRFYVNEEGDSEDVDVGDRIELARVGKGSSRRTGVLVVESDRLARGGMLTLSNPTIDQISGYQPLGSGFYLTDSSGQQWPVYCADSE